MGNFLQFSMLKSYAPSLANRNQFGGAKIRTVGGVDRTAHTSQSHKSAIIAEMSDYFFEIRSANLTELVRDVLDKNIQLSKEECDAAGNAICKLFGAKWKGEKTSKNDEDAQDEPENKGAEGESDNQDEKGRTVVNINPVALHDIIMAALEDIRNNGIPVAKKTGKPDPAMLHTRLEPIAKEIIKSHPVSTSRALFGNMATSGVNETMYGALQMTDAFSIQPHMANYDDWTAQARLQYNKPEEYDPFYEALDTFAKKESQKAAAESMGRDERSAPTIYSYGNINIPEFYNNLTDIKLPGVEESAKEQIENVVPAFVETFIKTTPIGKQRSASTHIMPAIIYVSSIWHDQPYQVNFETPIYYNGQNSPSIEEQGVEQFLVMAQDKAIYYADNVSDYVVLSSKYRDKYAPKFEACGTRVLNSIQELKNAIKDDVKKLYRNLR